MEQIRILSLKLIWLNRYINLKLSVQVLTHLSKLRFMEVLCPNQKSVIIRSLLNNFFLLLDRKSVLSLFKINVWKLMRKESSRIFLHHYPNEQDHQNLQVTPKSVILGLDFSAEGVSLPVVETDTIPKCRICKVSVLTI